MLFNDGDDLGPRLHRPDFAKLGYAGSRLAQGGNQGHEGIVAADAPGEVATEPVDDEDFSPGCNGLLSKRVEAARQEVAPGTGGNHHG